MRNLILILVLSLAAFVSTGAAAMAMDHAGPAPAEAVSQPHAHECPDCPDSATGTRAAPPGCSDGFACGGIAAVVPEPFEKPCPKLACAAAGARTALCPQGRSDPYDPPPPRL